MIAGVAVIEDTATHAAEVVTVTTIWGAQPRIVFEMAIAVCGKILILLTFSGIGVLSIALNLNFTEQEQLMNTGQKVGACFARSSLLVNELNISLEYVGE